MALVALTPQPGHFAHKRDVLVPREDFVRWGGRCKRIDESDMDVFFLFFDTQRRESIKNMSKLFIDTKKPC